MSLYIKYWTILICNAPQVQCSPAIITLVQSFLIYNIYSESSILTTLLTSSFYTANLASYSYVISLNMPEEYIIPNFMYHRSLLVKPVRGHRTVTSRKDLRIEGLLPRWTFRSPFGYQHENHSSLYRKDVKTGSRLFPAQIFEASGEEKEKGYNSLSRRMAF